MNNLRDFEGQIKKQDLLCSKTTVTENFRKNGCGFEFRYSLLNSDIAPVSSTSSLTIRQIISADSL